MASNEENRKKFAKSAIDFINKYYFDGIDIDWEYPESGDKENFAKLLKASFFVDLKAVSNKKLVTIATASDSVKINAGYDVSEIAKSVDFVNVMTYDFHGSWEQKTGQNSPLFAPSGDSTKFNTADAMKYWAENGMPSEKLIVGIATYGRGWILNDPNDTKCGAPGSAAPGRQYTNAAGMAAYYEICKMDGIRKWDDTQKVPYILKDNLWYGYDDIQSINGKMNWLKENGFGGAFIWALDMDDFKGICSDGKKYPLLNAIKNGLEGKEITTIPSKPENTGETKPPKIKTTTPKSDITISDNNKNDFACPSSNGLFRDPKNCSKFYQCSNGTPFSMNCPTGLNWNDNIKY
uniref:Chitinase n=1 Tax=Panagrolaimus superbus TaxID=310955 RepID=A0A914Z7P6_9BILA